jgi:predicted DNA-binding antitoxin AbrB/MazE fold protein
MGQILEAIYEDGVLKPLEELDLVDVQEHLKAWHQIYEGFTEEEVTEVESIVLDRSNFMKRRVDV